MYMLHSLKNNFQSQKKNSIVQQKLVHAAILLSFACRTNRRLDM